MVYLAEFLSRREPGEVRALWVRFEFEVFQSRSF
jgi:hypothetical protein